MSQEKSFRANARAPLLIVVASVVVFAVSISTNAQHTGHDMPMPMPTATPKPKAGAKKTSSPHSQQQTPAQPTATPLSQPAASPSPMPMQMPAMPNAMAMPSPSPSPTSIASPTPATQETHAGHEGMAMPGMTMPGAGASKPDESGGMKMVNESDVDELMVMSGEEMGVRVGASKTNVVPMGQIASGTAWQPASSPLNMIHRRAGDWLLMFHYDVKLGVNHQGGARGATKFESSNWFMPMAYRRVGRGTLQLRAMLSLEPLTFPGAGSPELFQTGEARHGQPLVDVQHPHDLFMELSAQYQLALTERATWFAYVGYPGEPALGPVAFMHRASASENPTAPLAHHLEDSTHISYGVVTSGFTYRWFKLEGSIFNGREPDERRYNFEAHPWTSRAARLSFAPNASWTFQVSHGLLRNPEELEPGDTRRTTASAQYDKKFSRGNVAAALIWGRNHETHADGSRFNLNGYTFETTVNFDARNYAYTRLELVDKNALLRPSDLVRLGFTSGVAQPTFRIGAYTFGYVRDLFESKQWLVGLGGDFTLYSKPDVLDPIYGARPVSYKIFVRVRPPRMKMDHDMGNKQTGHDANAEHKH